MIRILALGALAAAVAAPAFAYSVVSIPAPHGEGDRFTNNPGVARLADGSGSVNAPFIRDQPTAAQLSAKRAIITLPRKGKVAERINWSDASDNPFMAAPLRDDGAR